MAINGQDVGEDCDYVDYGDDAEEDKEMKVRECICFWRLGMQPVVGVVWLSASCHGGLSLPDEETGPCLRWNLPAATAAPYGSSC